MVKGGNDGSAITGELHAVLSSGISPKIVNITPLSDVAYRVVREKTSRLSPKNITELLDATAKTLIKTDIDGDGAINYADILAFNPTEHQANLRFNYDELSKANENGDAIINAYRSGDEEILSQLYGSLFRGKLNFNLGGEAEAFDTRIELNAFGSGDVTTSIDIAYNSDNASNKALAFVSKGDQAITFTATPKTDTQIHSWSGC